MLPKPCQERGPNKPLLHPWARTPSAFSSQCGRTVCRKGLGAVPPTPVRARGLCCPPLTWLFSLLCEVSRSVSAAEQQLWKQSFSCFEKGILNFESIGDATNTALLLCNTGRLMRICAQAHCGAGSQGKREFSPEEGLYFNKVLRAVAVPHQAGHCRTENWLSSSWVTQWEKHWGSRCLH